MDEADAPSPDLVTGTLRQGTEQRTRRRPLPSPPLVITALAIVAVLLSPALGRAEPTGNYRPELPADPIALGCYPLPRGLTLDFPHQVRTDGDVDGRRVLRLQWDELDATEVRRRLDAALDRAGLPPTAATVTPLTDVAGDAIVRGEVELRLPVVPLSSDDPRCLDPRTTKRFPDDWAPSTEYGG